MNKRNGHSIIKAFLALAMLVGASPVIAQLSQVEKQDVGTFQSLLVNPGFENGKYGWTVSAGTFAINTTAANVGAGTASGAFTASASGQTLTSNAVTLPAGVYGNACRISYLYKGGANTLVAEVVDGSVVVKATETLATQSTYHLSDIYFACPTSGTLAFRLRSTASTAIVYLDQVYLGLAHQPMTTAGDLPYGGTAGIPTRLAASSATTVLHSGTSPTWSAVSLSADVTGSLPAGSLSGQVAIGNGGTGAATKAAGFDALSPMSGAGDLIYGGTSGTGTRLANSGNSVQTLHAGTSNVPAWGPITLTTDVTGLLGGTNGGTGVSSTATYPTSGVLVTRTSSDTGANRLQNKEFDANQSFVDPSDTSKKLQFPLTGAATSTTTQLSATSSASRIIALPDASTTLVGTDFAQTISAKVLTTTDHQGGTATDTSRITVPKDTLANVRALTRKQATIVYDTTADRLMSDDGTSLNIVGASQGEKNYAGPSAMTSIGWAASGAGITVAPATSGLPRPNTTKTGVLITGASGSTAYAYFRFILDDADANKKLKVQWDQFPVSGYLASDMKVDVYSNTASDYTTGNTRLALSTDSSAVSAIPALTGTYRTTFDAPAVSAKWIEVRIGLNGTNVHALTVSDFIVGPGVVTQGAAVTSTVSWTPTASWTTNTTWTGKYERIGDYGVYEAQAAFTGAPDAVSLEIILPTGQTIDTARMLTTSGFISVLGTGFLNHSTTARKLNVTYNANDRVRITYDLTDASGASATAPLFDNSITRTAPVTVANGDTINVSFRLPISQWTGSGTVNVAQNDCEYVSNSSTATSGNDTTSFQYGPSGQQVSSITVAGLRRVQFVSPISGTDKITLEYSTSATGPWGELVAQDGNADIQEHENQNGTSYGLGWSKTAGSTTQVDAYFGTYAWASSTYGAAGTAWSVANGDSTRWRIKKCAGGQAVGFGAATATNPGLVLNPMTATGDIEYSADAAGTLARLAIGGATTVLHGGTTPSYSGVTSSDITDGTIVNADVSGSAAIAGSKISPVFATHVDVSGAATLTSTASCSGSLVDLYTVNTGGELASAGDCVQYKVVANHGNAAEASAYVNACRAGSTIYGISLGVYAQASGSGAIAVTGNGTGTAKIQYAAVGCGTSYVELIGKTIN